MSLLTSMKFVSKTKVKLDRDLQFLQRDLDNRLAPRPDSQRYQRRRNSSYCGLPPVAEDMSVLETERRHSLTECEKHIKAIRTVAQAHDLKHPSQTLPECDWEFCSRSNTRRGSNSSIKSRASSSKLSRHGHRKQSLETGDFNWGGSNYQTSSSWGATASTRAFKAKIILLGDCGVGKSTFLHTLLSGKYTPAPAGSNITTSNVTKSICYAGQEMEVCFQDTAGQERFRSLTASYYRHARGCLLFFNIHNQDSFKSVERWLQDLNEYSTRKHVAVVLVGLRHKYTAPVKNNKYQREDSENNNNNNNAQPINSRRGSLKDCCSSASGDTSNWSDDSDQREVPRGQAEHFAEQWQLTYREVDCRHDYNAVIKTVHNIVELVMQDANIHPENHITTTISPGIHSQISKPSCCRSC